MGQVYCMNLWSNHDDIASMLCGDEDCFKLSRSRLGTFFGTSRLGLEQKLDIGLVVLVNVLSRSRLGCNIRRLGLVSDMKVSFTSLHSALRYARHWLFADTLELECRRTKNLSWSASVDGD